jgi:flagellar biosynthesis protein FliQ
MQNQLYDVFLMALKCLYLIAAPSILVIFVAGSLASILQSAMSVQEATMNYAVRVIALVLLLYLILPAAVRSITDLAAFALK